MEEALLRGDNMVMQPYARLLWLLTFFLSVLWHWWLNDRMSIQPTKPVWLQASVVLKGCLLMDAAQSEVVLKKKAHQTTTTVTVV